MISILGDREAMVSLGARIREHRLHRNFSQTHMAQILGVSLPTYRKIEQGDGSVEFRHVAKALGVFGYAERLPEILPEPASNLSIKELLAPVRKHASRSHAKTP